jgi:hypothetical protein
MASKTVQGASFTAGESKTVIETPISTEGDPSIQVGKVLLTEYPEGGAATWLMTAVDAQGKELGTKIARIVPDPGTVVAFFTQASKKARK